MGHCLWGKRDRFLETRFDYQYHPKLPQHPSRAGANLCSRGSDASRIPGSPSLWYHCVYVTVGWDAGNAPGIHPDSQVQLHLIYLI